MARNYPQTGPLNEADHSVGANVAVFMSFVAAGCVYIILAKLKGTQQFYVTFVPVGTMIAYALLITLSRGLRLRDDQSGDNLYYMGFLFTLTSLGVSLYQFSASHAAGSSSRRAQISWSIGFIPCGLTELQPPVWCGASRISAPSSAVARAFSMMLLS